MARNPSRSGTRCMAALALRDPARTCVGNSHNEAMATVWNRGHVTQSIRRGRKSMIKSGSEWRKSFTKKVRKPPERTAVIPGPPIAGESSARENRCPCRKNPLPERALFRSSGHKTEPTPAKLHIGLQHSSPGVLANGRNPRPNYVSKGSENSIKGGRISEKRNPAAQNS